MMEPRTVRIVTALIVVVFVAMTVLGAFPAGAAEPLSRSTSVSVTAGKQASALIRARAKAERARQAAKKAVRVRERAVREASDPARVYEAAVGAQARATAAVGETQAALDSANAVLAGEAVRRADITARYDAAKASFDAAAEAHRAAGEQMTALRTAQTGLVEQLNAAYASVKVVAATAADVELVRIPAAAGAVTVAWRAEQKARAGRVKSRERFAAKKAEFGSCRHPKKGGWECQSRGGDGRWRDVPVLDGLSKKMAKSARGYARATKVRQTQETYLQGLKQELADRRAELAVVEATAEALDGQVAAGRSAVSAAETETSRLRVVADEWDKTLDGIVAEGQKFTVEVDAARAQQPELAARIAPLSAEVTAAQAQVAAVQGAHTAAQAQVVAAQAAAKKAKRVLAKAVKRVKALSRRR